MNPPHDEIVQANGVDLCVETFGDPADPAILLIMGSSASMDWWEDEFCGRLAAGSRFVIRYDHRDTGRSVSYPPGAPQYTMQRPRRGCGRRARRLRRRRAHIVVGMSMGGAIAQLVALDHPDRVASLTLISTAPAGPGPDDPDLPAMSEETGAAVRASAAARLVRPGGRDRLPRPPRARVRSGSRPFDEARVP